MTTPDQSVQASHSYDGYGVMLGGNPAFADQPPTNLLYCGEQFDMNCQQYYLRARYYNPANGLFNRVDPYSGNLQDPQSLHRYAYCHNNPTYWTDPAGQSIWDFIQSMGPEQALRILIGIRVTYRLGKAYIDEEGRYKDDVDINVQIARLSDRDIESGGVEWNGVYKLRPDIADRIRGDVYEVRPDNQDAILKGRSDVMKYINVLSQRHTGKTFFAGNWQPKELFYSVGSVPGLPWMEPIKITARNAGGGVIAYRIDDKDLDDRIVELIDAIELIGITSVAIQINQAITMAQALNVGEMVVKNAVRASIAESMRQKEMVGIVEMKATLGTPF